MEEKKIWLSPPHMGGNELGYIQNAFDTNWISQFGPHINKFENYLENYLGENSFVTAVSSGTAAIHLALKLLNIQPGDIVLSQSFTFVASANPILYEKAVFLDERMKQRRLNQESYHENLKYLGNVEWFSESYEDFYSDYWVDTIQIKKIYKLSKEIIKNRFSGINLKIRCLRKSVHLEHLYKEYDFFGNNFMVQFLSMVCACVQIQILRVNAKKAF